VKLTAGPNQKPYVIHKSLLCYYSPYFAAALNGSFKEAEENALKIDGGFRLEVVNLFFNWLYTQTIPETRSPEIRAILNRGIESKDFDVEWDMLMTGLYIFGDRYNVPKLRKDVMDKFYSKYELGDGTGLPYGVPSYGTVLKAFNGLPDNSKLCHFFVCIYGTKWDSGCDGASAEEIKARDEVPRIFLSKVMLKMGDVRKYNSQFDDEPPMPGLCAFHEHGPEATNACRKAQRVETAVSTAAERARMEAERAVAVETRRETMIKQAREKRLKTSNGS